MTVGDALRLHPKVRWVLVAYHVGHCSTCPVSEEETLEQVATGYGFPLEKLLDDLNALADHRPGG
jgi:hybrid cluster-associated redox disulfide protein